MSEKTARDAREKAEELVEDLEEDFNLNGQELVVEEMRTIIQEKIWGEEQ